MPVLDKLTTVVEWEVDTTELERYESLVQESRASTAGMGSAVSAASTEVDQAAAAMGSLNVEIPIVSDELRGMSRRADAAAGEVSGLSSDADAAAGDLQTVAGAADRAGRGMRAAGGGADDMGRALDDLGSDISSTLGGIAKLGAAAAGVFAGIGVISAKELTSNVRLAESVGITAESYLAWDRVMQGIGFTGERVVDMAEEGANKLGELQALGEMSSAQDSLRMLGLEFAEIRDLAPEEQFREIMSAAKDLDDGAIARSAVDMVFGGEANKVLGHLRTLDGSLDDILDGYARYNFLTDRGVAGSANLADMFNNLEMAGSTFFNEILGRASGSLGPMVEQFFDWVEANRELIDQKIDEYAEAIAGAFRWLGRAAERVGAVVDALGGAERIIKGVAIAFTAWKLQSWVTALSSIVTQIGATELATKGLTAAMAGLKAVGITGLFVAAGLAIEDFYVYMTGGDSAIGRFTDEMLPKAESALLSFFGVIDDDMTLEEQRIATAEWQQSFLEAIDSIKGAFTGFYDWISGAVSAVYGHLVTDAESLITNVVSAVTSAVDFVSEGLSKILGFLRGLPVIGSLFDGINVSAPAIAAASPMPVDTVQMSSAGGFFDGASSSRPVTPMRSGGATSAPAAPSKFDVRNQITINGAPGMSEREIARQVSREVDRSMARTFDDVRTTGIKR